MKALLRVLIGLCVAACVGSARAELSPLTFVLGKQQFKPGDAIVIDQVLASSPKLDVGTKVIVRGHYRLASATKARLGLFVTHRSRAGAEPFPTSQMTDVDRASGTFELACEMKYAGDLHVSFYPAGRGQSFGGVYVSAAAH